MVSSHRSVELRRSVLDKLDGFLFAFAGLATLWLAYLIVQEGVRPGWPWLLLVVFWAVLTYLLLPRLHRILTHIYVPNYFIGRTRTSDGLLGDPINVALLGTEAQLHAAMTRARWTRADDLGFRSTLAMIRSTLTRRSYPEAPVSPLHLFDRIQDFAYQQEVDGNPAKRHHVRFWRTPSGWPLPGGAAVDWLAAGTYDRSVGLSLFTLQITHKIEQDTDIERDFLVTSLADHNAEASVEVIEDFSTSYHSRNGGGDLIRTDGNLPVVDLTSLAAPSAAAAERTDSRDKRPFQTVFGALMALVQGLLYLTAAVIVFINSGDVAAALDTDGSMTVIAVIEVALVLAAAWDVVLAVFTFLGRNWARILLMLTAVLAVVSAFIGNAQQSSVITLASLPTIADSILLLLALSSHRAREYAARGRRTPRRLTRRRASESAAVRAQ